MSGSLAPSFELLLGEGPSDPTRREVLIAGTAPMLVAVLAALWPQGLPVFLRAILWSTLLLPIGLLARYRYRRGATVGLGVSLVVLLFGEVALRRLLGSPVDGGLIVAGSVLAAASAWTIGRVAGQLDQERREMLATAYRDEETGLPREQLIELFLEQHFSKAERGDDMTLVLFGLGGLEALRRSHGDGAAASVLGSVGDAIQRNSRGMDVAGRLGPSEVLAILPDTDADGARTYAVRCLEKMSGLSAETADGALIASGVEIRAGIAEYDGDVESAENLVERARRALDVDAGPEKNRITIFSAPSTGTT